MAETPLSATRLRVLFEVTRRGSVSAAADALWITPSAVSQAIAALERKTGTELLTRAGRGVAPTLAGRTLADHAERVISALDAASAALTALDDRAQGRLRVAAFPSVVINLLAPAVDGLRASQPDLVVDVEDLEGALALDAVRLGRIDLAIVDDWSWGGGERLGGVTVTELAEDPLVVVLPHDSPLTDADAVRWSQLAGLALVVEDPASLYAQAVAAECRRHGFEPRALANVHDLAATFALVRHAGYAAVLPRLATAGLDLPVRPLVPALRRRLLTVTRGGEEVLPGIVALLAAFADGGAG